MPGQLIVVVHPGKDPRDYVGTVFGSEAAPPFAEDAEERGYIISYWPADHPSCAAFRDHFMQRVWHPGQDPDRILV